MNDTHDALRRKAALVLSEDRSMLIVETDLPELLEEKRLIVKALIPLSERTNYHLRSANVLDAEEVWNAAGLFKRDPITVVHEGRFNSSPCPNGGSSREISAVC